MPPRISRRDADSGSRDGRAPQGYGIVTAKAPAPASPRVSATVIGALRRFLPTFLDGHPSLSVDQRRALWAITHCRTPALGGKAEPRPQCAPREASWAAGTARHFAWHSCNHKACPQCGRAATAHWVERELTKLLPVPYFLVTFTLPAQLRSAFFEPHARAAFDLLFRSAAAALSEKLAADKP